MIGCTSRHSNTCSDERARTSAPLLRAMIPTGTIHEILNQKGGQAWSIGPEATVFEAIGLMSEKNIGALLVVRQGKLVGILSERDYTRKVALHGKSSKQTKVKEIISGRVISVNP